MNLVPVAVVDEVFQHAFAGVAERIAELEAAATRRKERAAERAAQKAAQARKAARGDPEQAAPRRTAVRMAAAAAPGARTGGGREAALIARGPRITPPLELCLTLRSLAGPSLVAASLRREEPAPPPTPRA
jgi:hypothetical protein